MRSFTLARSVLPLARCRAGPSTPILHRGCGPSLRPTGETLFRHLDRSIHTTTLRRADEQTTSSRPVEGSTDISHSTFISSASASSDFNPHQTPEAGVSTSSPWQGHLSPTSTHLLKLILPLPTSSPTFKWNSDPTKTGTQNPQPTAFLLHPSQPLSHLSRLIAGSLPVKYRDCEVEYLALTGQEDDLDSHLRNAENEKKGRMEGGPFLGERERSRGRFQEVSWSQATDLADFVKQSCLNEKFKIVITPRTIQDEHDARVENSGETSGQMKPGMALEVLIPSFASRTTYLRKRLLELTKSLNTMTKQKKSIDVQAHKGAQKLAVAGLSVGAAYWVVVIRMTFFTDAGWDLMEPVTWATGFGALLASCAFLVYHNREVSYSSLLDLSITARQQRLYDEKGLDIERWTEMVSEAKTLRKEIARIAADYDIEWKGELENLAKDSMPLEDRLEESDSSKQSDKSHREQPSTPSSESSSASSSSSNAPSDKQRKHETTDGSETNVNGEKGGKGKKLDIDKTIDEASDLAEQTDLQKNKERAAQRKGEVVDDRDDRGIRKEEREKSEKAGVERGMEKVGENRKKYE